MTSRHFNQEEEEEEEEEEGGGGGGGGGEASQRIPARIPQRMAKGRRRGL